MGRISAFLIRAGHSFRDIRSLLLLELIQFPGQDHVALAPVFFCL